MRKAKRVRLQTHDLEDQKETQFLSLKTRLQVLSELENIYRDDADETMQQQLYNMRTQVKDDIKELTQDGTDLMDLFKRQGAMLYKSKNVVAQDNLDRLTRGKEKQIVDLVQEDRILQDRLARMNDPSFLRMQQNAMAKRQGLYVYDNPRPAAAAARVDVGILPPGTPPPSGFVPPIPRPMRYQGGNFPGAGMMVSPPQPRLYQGPMPGLPQNNTDAMKILSMITGKTQDEMAMMQQRDIEKQMQDTQEQMDKLADDPSFSEDHMYRLSRELTKRGIRIDSDVFKTEMKRWIENRIDLLPETEKPKYSREIQSRLSLLSREFDKKTIDIDTLNTTFAGVLSQFHNEVQRFKDRKSVIALPPSEPIRGETEEPIRGEESKSEKPKNPSEKKKSPKIATENPQGEDIEQQKMKSKEALKYLVSMSSDPNRYTESLQKLSDGARRSYESSEGNKYEVRYDYVTKGIASILKNHPDKDDPEVAEKITEILKLKKQGVSTQKNLFKLISELIEMRDAKKE